MIKSIDSYYRLMDSHKITTNKQCHVISTIIMVCGFYKEARCAYKITSLVSYHKVELVLNSKGC